MLNRRRGQRWIERRYSGARVKRWISWPEEDVASYSHTENYDQRLAASAAQTQPDRTEHARIYEFATYPSQGSNTAVPGVEAVE